jgi:hypothetical protein
MYILQFFLDNRPLFFIFFPFLFIGTVLVIFIGAEVLEEDTQNWRRKSYPEAYEPGGRFYSEVQSSSEVSADTWDIFSMVFNWYVATFIIIFFILFLLFVFRQSLLINTLSCYTRVTTWFKFKYRMFFTIKKPIVLTNDEPKSSLYLYRLLRLQVKLSSIYLPTDSAKCLAGVLTKAGIFSLSPSRLYLIRNGYFALVGCALFRHHRGLVGDLNIRVAYFSSFSPEVYMIIVEAVNMVVYNSCLWPDTRVVLYSYSQSPSHTLIKDSLIQTIVIFRGIYCADPFSTEAEMIKLDGREFCVIQIVLLSKVLGSKACWPPKKQLLFKEMLFYTVLQSGEYKLPFDLVFGVFNQIVSGWPGFD